MASAEAEAEAAAWPCVCGCVLARHEPDYDEGGRPCAACDCEEFESAPVGDAGGSGGLVRLPDFDALRVKALGVVWIGSLLGVGLLALATGLGLFLFVPAAVVACVLGERTLRGIERTGGLRD